MNVLYCNDKRGAAALLLVVILGVAALLMAVGASRLSLGEIEMGYNAQKGAEAFGVADGCAEEALERLRVDAGYTGGSLPLGGGTCIITVVTGANTVIDATGSVGGYHRRIEISLTLNNHIITIFRWNEVAL